MEKIHGDLSIDGEVVSIDDNIDISKNKNNGANTDPSIIPKDLSKLNDILKLNINKEKVGIKKPKLNVLTYDINSHEYESLSKLKGLSCQTAYGKGILRNIDINNISISKPIMYKNEMKTITTETLNTTTTVTTTTTTKTTSPPLSNEDIITTLHRNIIIEVDLLSNTKHPEYPDICKPENSDKPAHKLNAWGKAFLSPQDVYLIPPDVPAIGTTTNLPIAPFDPHPLITNLSPLPPTDDTNLPPLKSITPQPVPSIPPLSTLHNTLPSPSSAFHKVSGISSDFKTPSINTPGINSGTGPNTTGQSTGFTPGLHTRGPTLGFTPGPASPDLNFIFDEGIIYFLFFLL